MLFANMLDCVTKRFPRGFSTVSFKPFSLSLVSGLLLVKAEDGEPKDASLTSGLFMISSVNQSPSKTSGTKVWSILSD